MNQRIAGNVADVKPELTCVVFIVVETDVTVLEEFVSNAMSEVRVFKNSKCFYQKTSASM